MHKIILSILLIASAAFADDIDVVKKVEEIQVKLKSMSVDTSDPLCQSCAPREKTFNSCIKEICGTEFKDVHSTLSGFISKSLSDPAKKAEIISAYKDVNQKLNEMIIFDLDMAIAQVEKRKEILNNGTFTERKEGAQFFVGFTLMTEGGDKIDSESLKKIADELKGTFVNSAENYTEYFHPPSIYYEDKYLDNSLKQAFNNDIQTLEREIAAFKNSSFVKQMPFIQEELDGIFSTEVYKKIKSNQDVTTEEMRPILNNLFILQAINGTINNPDFTSTIKKIDLSQIKSQIQSDKSKNKLNALLSELKRFRQSPAIINSLSESCTSNLIAAYIPLPKEDEKNKAMVNFSEAKVNFVNKAFSIFSEESKKTLIGKSAKWKFTADTRKDYLTSYKTRLKSTREDSNLERENDDKKTPEENIDLYSYDMDHLFFPDDGNEQVAYVLKEHLTAYDEICEDISPGLSDRAYTASGAVVMSWMSLYNPSLGRAIAYHELGHLLSHALKSSELSAHSKGVHAGIKNCLSNKGGEAYTEENFADISAAIVGADNGVNVGCILQDKQDDWNRPLLTHPPSEEYSHATSFFRLLNTEKIRNKPLPLACKQTIGNEPLNSLEQCWPDKDGIVRGNNYQRY